MKKIPHIFPSWCQVDGGGKKDWELCPSGRLRGIRQDDSPKERQSGQSSGLMLLGTFIFSWDRVDHRKASCGNASSWPPGRCGQNIKSEAILPLRAFWLLLLGSVKNVGEMAHRSDPI